MQPMLPPAEASDPVWAIVVAIIYFGSFIAIGLAARIVLGRLMRQSSETLAEIHAQAGPRRDKRTVFLLGAWRSER
jgi:hypothetical protein